MDKLIHTSLNALTSLRDTQVVSAQNLANQSVPGYRRDLVNDGTSEFMTQFGEMTGRAFQSERGAHAFSDASGYLDQTGENLDVAIEDQGYFYIQPENGKPALSRRGDLRVGADGALVNGAGEPMLDSGMKPIKLPPFKSVQIDDLGQISIEPMQGPAGTLTPVAMLATVVPGKDVALEKSLDGQIRAQDGTLPPPNQGAKVLQGVLEQSNVNTTDELINSIQLQRTFEVNLRMISTAKELDEAGSKLLRLPEN